MIRVLFISSEISKLKEGEKSTLNSKGNDLQSKIIEKA